MDIVKTNRTGISQAVAILKKEGVIIYPTDTAYGLGGIFDSKKVQDRILAIKKRQDKKFTLVASSFAQVQKYFKLNLEQKKLAKKYWPGPLSIVVSDRFAVRVPKNFVAQKLARLAGKPLIASSANLSGEKTAYSFSEVKKNFTKKFRNNSGKNFDKAQPDLIIDTGRLARTEVSTVVKVSKGKINVLRPGSVKVLPSRQ